MKAVEPLLVLDIGHDAGDAALGAVAPTAEYREPSRAVAGTQPSQERGKLIQSGRRAHETCQHPTIGAAGMVDIAVKGLGHVESSRWKQTGVIDDRIQQYPGAGKHKDL